MIKIFILPLILAFLFTACAIKIPFFDNTNENELKEANICQNIENQDRKMYCYEKILEENSYAQLRMGIYYADKKKYDASIKYLTMAKENDNLYANLALAFLYYQGQGVQRDEKKSFELLEESSELDPNAAYQLSRFYLQGITVQIDTNKALELIIFAADKNMLVAQKKLIDIYSKGLFRIKKDSQKVKFWEDKIKEKNKDLTYDIYKL